MSLQVYPSIDPNNLGVRGVAWPVTRRTQFSNITQATASGKEFRLALWQYARYLWTLDYSILFDQPANLFAQNPYTDLQTIEGFYEQMQGDFGIFDFWDPNDNTVQGQQFGTGDGSTTVFQLSRTYGGATNWVQQPIGNPTIKIYINGVTQNSASYAISNVGAVTFTSAPANAAVITGDFSYYWPARFNKGELDFSEFMYQLWELGQVEIYSVKL